MQQIVVRLKGVATMTQEFVRYSPDIEKPESERIEVAREWFSVMETDACETAL
jgi:hypothetical protein